MAGVGTAAGAEPAQAPKHAQKRPATHAHTETHTQVHKPAHASAHAGTHAGAHASTHAAARKPAAKVAHQPAHTLAHKPAHATVHKPAAKLAAKPAHPAARAAALAAHPAPSQPAPGVLPKPAASTADPDGEGFLNLYVELCVKRIGEIDAFREKLLRGNVPKLQPDSAKAFLSGMAGDAWPVPYQGKTGNFVLVLPAQKNLCMLYARRTDTAAVEQGFAAMVAKAPDPMIARRGPESHAGTPAHGTHTVSTSWAPPGSERKMQFVLTTTSSPDSQVQAFGSVAIVVGSEPGPGPEKAAAGPVTRSPSGLPGPGPRPRAQP